jgi:hypothetical protein
MSCPPDKEINPKTGRCIKKCPDGHVRNKETMRCVRGAAAAARATVRSRGRPKKREPTPPPPPPPPKPECAKTEELNPNTGRCVKKCAKTQERNPHTGRCIKKCPAGQVRDINTMKCGVSLKEPPNLLQVLNNLKVELEQEKAEEKKIKKATNKIHRFPKDNKDSIVIFIYGHGTVLEKSAFKDKIYWHSHNPNNGCIVTHIKIDNKQLSEIVYDLYKKSTKKDGELHTEVLSNYCNIIHERIVYRRSLHFLINVVHTFVKMLREKNKSYTALYNSFDMQLFMLDTTTRTHMTPKEEDQKFQQTMKIINDLENHYINDLENVSREITNQWKFILKVLFVYKIYKNEPKNKPCNQFKRMMKDKYYEFIDPDKEIEKGFGVFDIYNTKTRNPLKSMYEKGTNKLKMPLSTRLSTIYNMLKSYGYTNIYIYELSCNSNSVCNYMPGAEGAAQIRKLDTLAKTLSVQTATAAAAAEI